MTLSLTTGDLWSEPTRAVVAPAALELPPPSLRNTREYIERFRERMPLARAIRLKCGACMGGDPDRIPLGAVARAVDECASTACPLWPFRFGRDPWRPVSEAQREASRSNAAKLRRAVPITAREREDAHPAHEHEVTG